MQNMINPQPIGAGCHGANCWNAGLFLGCGVSIQPSESSPPGREVAGKLALAFALLVDRGTVFNSVQEEINLSLKASGDLKATWKAPSQNDVLARSR